jgi:hypothetical protein
MHTSSRKPAAPTGRKVCFRDIQKDFKYPLRDSTPAASVDPYTVYLASLSLSLSLVYTLLGTFAE